MKPFVGYLCAAVIAAATLTALPAPAHALRYCGSFAYAGKSIGFNAKGVTCRWARWVAGQAVRGRSAAPFRCWGGPSQSGVKTYTCASGSRRVYTYNANYGE